MQRLKCSVPGFENRGSASRPGRGLLLLGSVGTSSASGSLVQLALLTRGPACCEKTGSLLPLVCGILLFPGRCRSVRTKQVAGVKEYSSAQLGQEIGRGKAVAGFILAVQNL